MSITAEDKTRLIQEYATKAGDTGSPEVQVAILSSRLTFGEEFKATEVAGILLIGSGLVLLSLLSWAASRRNPGAHRDLAGEKQ